MTNRAAVQLRDTDGVDYEDTRIHKNTFLFLKDLKANNRRNWLKCAYILPYLTRYNFSCYCN